MVASRFSDALTFKEWLRRVYQDNEDKGKRAGGGETQTKPMLGPHCKNLGGLIINAYSPISQHSIIPFKNLELIPKQHFHSRIK
jgi:hypothetical protein